MNDGGYKEVAMIHQYNNKVFTYEGQCTVSAFFYEIMAWKEKMSDINSLVVYAGYHGDENGEFHHEFDVDEIDTMRSTVSAFPNAQIHWVTSQGLSDEEIKIAYKKGSVFFIWCDSNNKIKSTLKFNRAIDLGSVMTLDLVG
jgi:hypothetical protein